MQVDALRPAAGSLPRSAQAVLLQLPPGQSAPPANAGQAGGPSLPACSQSAVCLTGSGITGIHSSSAGYLGVCLVQRRQRQRKHGPRAWMTRTCRSLPIYWTAPTSKVRFTGGVGELQGGNWESGRSVHDSMIVLMAGLVARVGESPRAQNQASLVTPRGALHCLFFYFLPLPIIFFSHKVNLNLIVHNTFYESILNHHLSGLFGVSVCTSCAHLQAATWHWHTAAPETAGVRWPSIAPWTKRGRASSSLRPSAARASAAASSTAAAASAAAASTSLAPARRAPHSRGPEGTAQAPGRSAPRSTLTAYQRRRSRPRNESNSRSPTTSPPAHSTYAWSHTLRVSRGSWRTQK